MNLGLLNVILPYVIALYKQLRDANPNQPALTDGEIIDLLEKNGDEIVDFARNWLATHPAK